jgi:hypothetical protein
MLCHSNRIRTHVSGPVPVRTSAVRTSAVRPSVIAFIGGNRESPPVDPQRKAVTAGKVYSKVRTVTQCAVRKRWFTQAASGQ